MADIFWGDSPIRHAANDVRGELVLRGGEKYYKISNYDVMPPFFVAVVSGYDHWMFVSSTGGLSCGRRSPEYALFPYYTDDKIHDAGTTTGSQTIFLVEKNGRTCLWKPFGQDVNVYDTERNLYKNQAGNKLVFEEINRDLGLVFSYCWSSSEQFGFVKSSTIRSMATDEVKVDVLDGVQNLLPFGIAPRLQTEMSTLGDAYKQAERVPGCAAAIYTLSSILTDRAEPSEALKATVAWSTGLESARVLLSEDQVNDFCAGLPVSTETFKKGKRGAFFVQASFLASPGQEKGWHILADVNQGPSEAPALLDTIRKHVRPDVIEQSVEMGTQRLMQLVGGSDGCQLSTDVLITGRHFSNTLFNIMRGGTFYDEYRFPVHDFLNFVEVRNAPLLEKASVMLSTQEKSPALSEVVAAARSSGNADLERLALEYLPLTFSRRHGDPSRPWNHFSIDIRNTDGSEKLAYEGNWRDIFQNWEALAISFPEYIESFVAKFVNASTADGFNPYRINTQGIDWEVLDTEDPWSNIGYWGDHQVNYLGVFLEMSRNYHPGKLNGYLSRELFTYADVPYRLNGYEALLSDPRNSVEYDEVAAKEITARVEQIGGDGKLVALADGSIHKVNLMEKLLVVILSKTGSLVPGGGIWMNTQRPEWNDANNALVGYGLSMVTLCYLRRFLLSLADLLTEAGPEDYAVSEEVVEYFRDISNVLQTHSSNLEDIISPIGRKAFMDEMGASGTDYRERIYRGFCGQKSTLERSGLLAFINLVSTYLDHSIAHSRRPDGLYHSYNLIHFDDAGYSVEHLYEMLEGQVAILNSGCLTADECKVLLDTLRNSELYRSDQNSYMLYPDRKLPLFLEKNVIPASMVEASAWIQGELSSGRRTFIEQDINGAVHFNAEFRNAAELRNALNKAGGVSSQGEKELCLVYESVFRHRQFTGRSGAMYKYEGLGSIYWHMVSKLLLSTANVITLAARNNANPELLTGLVNHYYEIGDGLGVHKSPDRYGAFTIDPYSHTPAFAGVQQPGMTGQVKEDIISRFCELGVFVDNGEIQFSPVMLQRSEFLSEPRSWRFFIGGSEQIEDLRQGSLAFTLCGVPVIYRISEDTGISVFQAGGQVESLAGTTLDRDYSRSIFRREKRVTKIVVDIPAVKLR